MTRITVDTIINAPKARVWDVVSQLDTFAAYHPLLTRSYYMSEQREGVGAQRMCEVSDKLAFEETVVDWQPGESLVVTAEYTTGRGAPVRDYRGTIRLQANDSRTHVTMITEYEPKGGLAGKLIDRVLVKRAYTRITQQIMIGLKHHIETGETVNQDTLKRIAA